MKLGWEIQKNIYISRTWESEKRERMGWRHGDGARASWEILVFYWAPLNSAVSSKPASSECYLGKKITVRFYVKIKESFTSFFFSYSALLKRYPSGSRLPPPLIRLHERWNNPELEGLWSVMHNMQENLFFFHPASQIHSEHLLENCGNSRQLTTRDAKIYR